MSENAVLAQPTALQEAVAAIFKTVAEKALSGITAESLYMLKIDVGRRNPQQLGRIYSQDNVWSVDPSSDLLLNEEFYLLGSTTIYNSEPILQYPRDVGTDEIRYAWGLSQRGELILVQWVNPYLDGSLSGISCSIVNYDDLQKIDIWYAALFESIEHRLMDTAHLPGAGNIQFALGALATAAIMIEAFKPTKQS